MGNNGSICLVTLDGTDCPIQEPSNFNKAWWSHKFNGPAVRYEVAVCIQTGWIVWVNGPYPAGEWPDARIARDILIYMLDRNEKVMADGTYSDGNLFFVTPDGTNSPRQYMMKKCRARHETINGRIKKWRILSSPFRHRLKNHGSVFKAIANIEQLVIEHEVSAFHVEYYDRF